MVRNILLVCLGAFLAGIVISSPVEQFDEELGSPRLQKAPPELLELLLSLKLVNETVKENVPAVKGQPVEATTCNCGVKGSPRIAGGTLAGEPEWPWQAYLLIEGEYVCGGTLINEIYVVTAAHCIKDKTLVEVYLGLNDIRKEQDAPHVSQAVSLIYHPMFTQNAETYYNDIGLIQLKTPVPSFSAAIRPICLPFKFATRDFKGQNATVTGWGSVKEGAANVNRLRETTMPVLNHKQCTTSPYLYTPGRINPNMFCMYKKGTDSCEGDFGGPVNWQDKASGRVYLIGISSFGNGCAKKNWPGVYTKVNDYLNWIELTTEQKFCKL